MILAKFHNLGEIGGFYPKRAFSAKNAKFTLFQFLTEVWPKWTILGGENVVLQLGFDPNRQNTKKLLFSNGFRAFPEGALGE